MAVAVVVNAAAGGPEPCDPNPLRWLAKLWWQGMSERLRDIAPGWTDIAGVESDTSPTSNLELKVIDIEPALRPSLRRNSC